METFWISIEAKIIFGVTKTYLRYTCLFLFTSFVFSIICCLYSVGILTFCYIQCLVFKANHLFSLLSIFVDNFMFIYNTSMVSVVVFVKQVLSSILFYDLFCLFWYYFVAWSISIIYVNLFLTGSGSFSPSISFSLLF